MPDNQISVTGLINDKGEYGIYNKGMLEDFCKKNPNKRLLLTVFVDDKDSINAKLRYYNAVVLPMWQQYFFQSGEVKNLKQIDKHLKSICPITDEKTSLSSLPKDELQVFLDLVSIESLDTANFPMTDSRLI